MVSREKTVRHCRWLSVVEWLALVAILVGCGPVSTVVPPQPPVETPVRDSLRLFIVRSSGVNDLWSSQVRIGLVEGLVPLGYHPGTNLIVEEFPLNADQQLGQAFDEEILKLAVVTAQEFEPDIIILLDDEAAVRFIPAYPDPEQLFVFTSLSVDVEEYDLDRPNVTGVLEEAYPVETMRLARDLLPRINRVMIISDASLSGWANAEQAQAAIQDSEDLDMHAFVYMTDSWENWQQIVLEETDWVQVVLLGKYDQVVDASGKPVPNRQVLDWTLQNSPVPVFGLWMREVQEGAVGGLVLSPYEQGNTTAQLTASLASGIDPFALPPRLPERKVLAINVAAMNYWELKFIVPLLRVARVYQRFPTP